MDEADHVLMAEEALAHLGVAAAGGKATDVGGLQGDGPLGWSQHGGAGGADQGGGCAGGPSAQAAALHNVQAGEALRRMRLLQDYLCAYEAQGLPMVKVSYGAFGEALDKLHEYVLQCIKVAMSSR
jgi:hypothetical protein